MTGLPKESAVPEAAPHEPPSSFDLVFRPSVELISVVRCFVEDFFQKSAPDPDTADRLALTTHELLENAAKYSADGEAVLSIVYDRKRGRVAVCAANRASSGQIALLQSTFAEISSVSDAAAFYAEAMRRTAIKDSGSGGLGLARIWAESEMELRLVVQGDRVEVHARGQIGVG